MAIKKENKILEARRKKIKPDVDIFINKSFKIADRIHEILEKKEMDQKDLAKALGKTESEISKWMRGTHNFTIKTISKLENILGEQLVQIAEKEIKTDKVIVVVYSWQSFLLEKGIKKSSRIGGEMKFKKNAVDYSKIPILE